MTQIQDFRTDELVELNQPLLEKALEAEEWAAGVKEAVRALIAVRPELFPSFRLQRQERRDWADPEVAAYELREYPAAFRLGSPAQVEKAGIALTDSLLSTKTVLVLQRRKA